MSGGVFCAGIDGSAGNHSRQRQSSRTVGPYKKANAFGLASEGRKVAASGIRCGGSGLAKVKTYKISSADYPGAGLSIVFDENDSTIIGDAEFGIGAPFGFTLTGSTYQQFNVPGASANEITGINTAGRIVGIYLDSSNIEHGFVETSGILTNIDNPVGAPNTTILYDINDHGEMVGAYQDASIPATITPSTTDGVSFHNFDYPGATGTIAAGIDLAGDIVGEWEDASMVDHGFLLKGARSSRQTPRARQTTAIGINDSGAISGYFTDASSLFHGFIYLGNTFTQVDVAGASETGIARIKNKGDITGVYIDSATR